MTATTEKLQDVCTQRYNGQSTTFWLTNGLTYTTGSTVADITALAAANKLSKVETLSTCTAGVNTVSVTWTNNGGTTFSFDGQAVVVDGRAVIEDFSNEVSGSIPGSGGTLTREFTLTAV